MNLQGERASKCARQGGERNREREAGRLTYRQRAETDRQTDRHISTEREGEEREADRQKKERERRGDT